MGIFSRFTDIVNSNINAILDKAEDPEKMVRLIIPVSYTHLTLPTKRIAELAINKDREDLARAALQEKKKCDEYAVTLDAELSAVDEQISKLQSEVTQLQDKLADAKARQKTIIMRQKTVSSRLDIKRTLNDGKVDAAMGRFEQYERKIDDLESQVDAYDLGKKTLADEFADLAADDDIDDALAALKKKVKKQSADSKNQD